MRSSNSVEPEVLDPEDDGREIAGGISTLSAQVRGEIDIQIVTANRFPRSLVTFKKTALEMATLDEETAESCLYALPRGSKTIDGPSARLAEVIASAYKHMRIEGRVVGQDDRYVTARGVAWDVQNNVAIAIEVKRRITDKNGSKFNDDMIGVTSNAAVSIAARNATLKVIPKAYWQPIYLACRTVVAGKAETLSSRRDAMLAHFLKLGVQNSRVFEALGVKGAEDITLDHLVNMKAVASAIKNGEVSVEGAFGDQSERGALPTEDVLHGYLDGLDETVRQEIGVLLRGVSLSNGQTAALLRKHAGKPDELVKELRAIAEKKTETTNPQADGYVKGSDPLERALLKRDAEEKKLQQKQDVKPSVEAGELSEDDAKAALERAMKKTADRLKQQAPKPSADIAPNEDELF